MIKCSIVRMTAYLQLVAMRDCYKSGRILKYKVEHNEQEKRLDICYVPFKKAYEEQKITIHA